MLSRNSENGFQFPTFFWHSNRYREIKKITYKTLRWKTVVVINANHHPHHCRSQSSANLTHFMWYPYATENTVCSSGYGSRYHLSYSTLELCSCMSCTIGQDVPIQLHHWHVPKDGKTLPRCDLFTKIMMNLIQLIAVQPTCSQSSKTQKILACYQIHQFTNSLLFV